MPSYTNKAINTNEMQKWRNAINPDSISQLTNLINQKVNLVGVTPMNNNSTTYIYNPNGTVQSATQKDSTGNVLRTDSYTYDSNGNITQSITSMNGQTSTTTYTYDSNGNITGMSNALS